MKEKFIGTFNLTDRKVIVSDPCYKKWTWCQGRLENVKTGVWNAAVKENSESRIAELIAYHSDIDLSSFENKWKTQPYDIGVDSGQAGFFQEDKFRNDATSLDLPNNFNGQDEGLEDGERWYGVCCDITLSRMGAGVLEGGVVSTSGYGDGCYTLYTLEKDNEVVAMKIVFIEEDSEDYYDEEE